MKNKNQNKHKLKIIITLLSLIFIMPMIFAEVTWGGSGTAQTQFNSGGAPECVDNGNNWKDPVSNGLIPSINDCSRTLVGGEKITCCPQEYTCNLTSNKCVANKIPILSCSDYKTEEKCKAFNIQDIETSIYNTLIHNLNLDMSATELKFCRGGQSDTFEHKSTAEGCRVYFGCDCVWNSTDCLGRYLSNNCSTVIDPPIKPPVEACTTNFKDTENLCGSEEDVYRISWTGEFSIDGVSKPKTESCKDGSKEFPCPSVSVIPFFTLMNFIISCLAIAGIYFFIRKNKHNLIIT